MATPRSDPEPGSSTESVQDAVPVDDPFAPVEPTEPGAVLSDWFDFSAGTIDDLAEELKAAFEVGEGDELVARTPRSEDLAEITVAAVRRYLYNRKAGPGRTDPRQAMVDWFSLPAAHEEAPQPFTLLTGAFHSPWRASSTELAKEAMAAVRRYLRDCAAQTASPETPTPDPKREGLSDERRTRAEW
ncbi:hypothetical protein ACIA49_38540 [Kribbella sp. NPDC051587]|uniref:hypothetical protein n=1 Tax=Kribbella sp. NPDC051587 TaxID=3364119 RepID=UPI00378E67B7